MRYLITILILLLCYAQAKTANTIAAAFKRGDYAAVKAMVTADPTLAQKQIGMGLYPLDLAAMAGQADLVTFLLDKGAPVVGPQGKGDPTRDEGVTVYAAYGGSREVGEAILDKSLPYTTKLTYQEKLDPYAFPIPIYNDNGNTPYRYRPTWWDLGTAIARGNADFCTLLLDKGASQTLDTLIKAPTALMVAGAGGRSAIAAQLLQKGADPKATYSGMTALHLAAAAGDAALVKLLLDAGAPINAPDKNGATPLMYALEARGGLVNSSAIRATTAVTGPLVDQLEDTAASYLPPLPPPPPADTADYKATVNLLLAKGASVKAPNFGGYSLAELIVLNGWSDVLETALAAGADPNAADAQGDTALHVAGTVDLVTVLLAHGASPNVKDLQGRTPLHAAASLDIAKLLLDHGADPNIQDNNGNTPLHEARTAELVQLFLDHHANVKVTNNDGITPLHDARDAQIAGLLLAAGANIEARDKHQDTPLITAAGLPDVVKFLLMKGADPNAKNDYGNTALICTPNIDSVRTLLEYGADVNATDVSGGTALTKAVSDEQTDLGDITQLLLEQPKIDVNAHVAGTRSPLYFAIQHNHSSTVAALIAKGADVNAAGPLGQTPLIFAVYGYYKTYALPLRSAPGGRQPTVSPAVEQRFAQMRADVLAMTTLLLKNGAKPNIQDTVGRTALHYAAYAGMVDVCKALVAAGGDATIKDNGGKTPVDLSWNAATKAALTPP